MSAACLTRLKKEYEKLKREPSADFEAIPLESNICIWHYVLKGPKDTCYEGGYYHGMIRFPDEYPYKPPSIIMLTPNGRFAVRTRICLSNSDFHPESWSPFWSINNILTGFISFMCEESDGIGSMQTPDSYKKHLASQSLEFNLQNQHFRQLFPHYITLYQHVMLYKNQNPSNPNSNNHNINQNHNNENENRNNKNKIQHVSHHYIHNHPNLSQLSNYHIFDYFFIMIIAIFLFYVWKEIQ